MVQKPVNNREQQLLPFASPSPDPEHWHVIYRHVPLGIGIKWKQMKPAENESRIRSYDMYETPNGIMYRYEFDAA